MRGSRIVAILAILLLFVGYCQASPHDVAINTGDLVNKAISSVTLPYERELTMTQLEQLGYDTTNMTRPGTYKIRIKSASFNATTGVLTLNIYAWHNGTQLATHSPWHWYMPTSVDGTNNNRRLSSFVAMVVSSLELIPYGSPIGDDAATLYPSVDGIAQEITDASWSTMRNDVGDGNNYTDVTAFVGYLRCANTPSTDVYIDMWRGILAFNTSSIGASGATIDSGLLKTTAFSRSLAIGSPSVAITSGTLTSNTSLANGDYDGFTSTALTDFVNMTSLSSSAGTNYNWTFNSVGKTYIQNNMGSTQHTVLYLRDSWDINNSYTGTWSALALNYWRFYTNETGTSSYRPFLYITYTPASAPVAAFSANATSGYPPFPILFTDASTNTPTDWDWYLNGDAVKDSDSQNPTYWYNVTIGNTITSYNCNLSAGNAVGSDWENKSNYITAYPLQANFSASVTSGEAPLSVSFTDSTTNGTATAWSWDFGGDGSSSSQNPTHVFNTPGIYYVQLNSSNTYSWDIENKTAYIEVFAPPEDWLSGYSYRQMHNLTGSSTWGQNATNYVVRLTVNTSSGTSSGDTLYLNGKSESDLSDLRFTDVDNNELSYWIQSTSNPYYVWVKVPTIYMSSNTTIYAYYGNPDASPSSNGYNTFPLFDHFETTGDSYNATYITSFSKSASNPIKRLGSQGWFGVMYNDYDSKFYIAIQNSSPGTTITMFSFNAANATNSANWTNHGTVYTATHTWEAYHIEPHSWVFESQHMADEREGVGAGLGTRKWRLYVCAESGYGTANLRWGFLVAPESDPTSMTEYSGNPISNYYLGDPKAVYYNNNIWVAQALYNVAGVTLDQDFYYSDDGVEDFSQTSRSWNTENIVEGQMAPFGDGWTMFGGIVDTGISEYFTQNGETYHAYASNPVVTSGAAGAYDDQIYWNAIAINKSNNVNIGGTYYLFYIGHNSTQDNICLATSTTQSNTSVTSDVDTSIWQDLGGNSVASSNLTITGAAAASRGIKTIAAKTYGANASVVEYSQFTTSSTNWFGFQNAAGNKYAGFSSSSTDHTETYSTSDQSINLPASFSGWSILEVYRNGTTNHKFYMNDSLINTHSTQVPTNTDMLVQSYTYGAVNKVVDWIFERTKYNTEPAHSDWGDEESNGVVADFTSNVTSGYPHFTVQFNDTSTGSPTDFEWIFDQGSAVDSTTRNATWNYTNVIGNTVTQLYVNFSAEGTENKDWENKSAYITLYPLNASFSANDTEGSPNLVVSFTDLSDNGTPTSWWWDFNEDGALDDANQSPTYTYTSIGLYNVSLNVSNAYSYGWLNLTDYINVTASPCNTITADFTSNVSEGYPAFAVYFEGNTTNATVWDWYFPNGGDAHTRNATWTFDYVIGNTITSYDINLNASSDCNYTWVNKTNFITAYPLNASFGANITSGYQALPVQFTDYTDNGTATEWYYDFGDMTTCLSVQNPVHIYTAVGTYTVQMNASNLYSWDWENKTYYIEVLQNEITANFTYNVTSGNAPVAVQFTDTSTANGTLPDAWTWYVNDVQNSTTQNPVITFSEYNQSTPICYTVRLNASNAYDYDWENKSMLVCTYPLNASFSTNVTSGCGPLSVQFTDLTDNGTPDWWNWSFGDGNFSDLQNPTHTYESVGDFDVTLLVKYGDYTFDDETKSAYIHVTGVGASASFTSNATDGYPSFAVAFTDTSGAGPATYYWEFGDGDTDNVQNPIHTYDSVIGNTLAQYTVNFNIDPGCGDDWENKSNYITAYPLNASFYANDTVGDAPLVVLFNSSITDNGTATSWWWDFNEDGVLDDANESPTYIYASPGTYNVSLNVSNAYSWDWLNLTDYITVNAPPGVPPVASFTVNTTYGYPSFAVAFTDTSTQSPTDWDWYVDGVKVSDLQNPVYTFNDVIGNTITYYDIFLYAANGDGGDWENRSNYIVAYPLNASFVVNDTAGCVPLPIAFTDQTDNGTPTTWDWDFGGEGTDNVQNPEYTFLNPGSFYIYLNASNAYSWDTLNRTGLITASSGAITADFSADDTTVTTAQVVTFTDASTGTPTGWAWDFDNNGVIDSALQNPTYTYTTAGDYTVNLTVTNGCGFSDNETKIDYINVTTAPVVSYGTGGGPSVISANSVTPGGSMIMVVLALGGIGFAGIIGLILFGGKRHEDEY